MSKEIPALKVNNTWKLTNLPLGKKALRCKWIYKIKYNYDGTVERFKARMVILGNHQVEVLDYNETFSLVAKMVTIRTTLTVAVARDWELHQMDVHNAFLHGDLDDDVYIKLHPGFQVSQPNLVCKLQKSLLVCGKLHDVGLQNCHLHLLILDFSSHRKITPCLVFVKIMCNWLFWCMLMIL